MLRRETLGATLTITVHAFSNPETCRPYITCISAPVPSAVPTALPVTTHCDMGRLSIWRSCSSLNLLICRAWGIRQYRHLHGATESGKSRQTVAMGSHEKTTKMDARDVTGVLPTRALTQSECEQVARHIADTVRKNDPVHLLTGFSFPIPPLNSTDYNPAFVEYLQHLILTQPPEPCQSSADGQLVVNLFDAVKDLFWGVAVRGKSMERSMEDLGEIANLLASDSLFVRGKSYLVHELVLLEELFGGVDGWLQANMAIAAADVARTARWLFETLDARLSTSIPAVQDALKRQPHDSFSTVLGCDIFRLCSPDSGIGKVLALLAAEPGSKPPGKTLLPGSERAVSRDYPILKTSAGLYCFCPQAVADELPRLLGEWIRDRDGAFFDKTYTKRREQLVTDMAVRRLAGVLPGARSYRNIFYVDNEGNRAETDGLVLYDDIAIVVEAKGKLLSFPARRGHSKRLERDYGEVIEKAFGQAKRTAKFIRAHGRAEFTDERGNPVVTVAGPSLRKVYLVNPLLDSMDPLAIELAEARASGLLSPDEEWPWCVSVNDLCVVTDILDSPTMFLLYLERRLRFNVHSGWFHVHDEHDLLDYFLRTALFLEQKPMKGDGHFQWQADTGEMDKYYRARALGTELPSKPSPPFIAGISALVNSIEHSGVLGRTVLATTILACEEKIHREILGNLLVAHAHLSQRHIPQIVVVHRKEFGITFWLTEEFTLEIKRRMLDEDACRKYENTSHEWLSAFFLVNGEMRSLVAVVRNADPWREDAAMAASVRAMRADKFETRRGAVHPGRNDRCPCGSGRKFKKCHGREDTEPVLG